LCFHNQFGAYGTYFFSCNTTPFLSLFDILTAEQKINATLGDDLCRIMVCMIGMPATLADKFGLIFPII